MKNIMDFGAVPDGVTLNTAAIQKAIDAAAAAGGGQVRIPAGVFLTGTLRLRDRIDLHLEPGAVLLASPDPADYNALDEYPQNWSCPREGWQGIHLILAIGLQDVSITGRGIIDGNGERFYPPPRENIPPRNNYAWSYGFRMDKNLTRPGQLMVFCECRNILVSGVTLRNASCWCCYLLGCQDAVIDGLIVRNPPDFANTDGIDIDCCRNVMISNCNIDTGDDAITLRGSEKHLGYEFPCENITVTNCILASSVCGFRIGVGSGTIRNAAISNIVIRRSGTGLLLQSAYSPGSGVDIYDLTVSGIRFDQTAHPVRICAGFPDTTAQIHHIAFTNLYGNCYANIAVIGQKAARPHDISFEQCSFHVVKSPFRLAEQKDYPSFFLAVESADRISTREFSWRQDEDSLPFWNLPPGPAPGTAGA